MTQQRIEEDLKLRETNISVQQPCEKRYVLFDANFVWWPLDSVRITRF